MHIALSILAIVLSIVLVVGIHEAGHALSARIFSVRIKQIVIGFGKPLYCWTLKSGSQLIIALWPLGGYVRLCNTRISHEWPTIEPYCFDKKSISARTIILLSGAVLNLGLAFTALLFLFLLGYQQHLPIILKMRPNSIASSASLQASDRITVVGREPTQAWTDVNMQLMMHIGEQSVPLIVCNQANTCRNVTLDLRLQFIKPASFSLLNAIGIIPNYSYKYREHVNGLSFQHALSHAYLKMTSLICFFFIMLKQIVTGAIPFAVLLGPVGLFEAMIQSFFQGVAVFLFFIANLSIAMAIINLLPIPGLDGGSIVYGIVEKIRGKPISVALEVLIYRLLFIGFCILLVHLIVNDLKHYLGT